MCGGETEKTRIGMCVGTCYIVSCHVTEQLYRERNERLDVSLNIS